MDLLLDKGNTRFYYVTGRLIVVKTRIKAAFVALMPHFWTFEIPTPRQIKMGSRFEPDLSAKPAFV